MPNIELTVTEDSPIELNVLSDTLFRLGVNEQIINSGGGGMSDDVKQALLDLIEHLAFIDADGQDYYDALYAALYPPTELDYITAVYTQSGTVYDTDSLDDLKTDLVVTAHNSDGTSETVTTYTLSGTLTEGTSTIMVSYGGKTTTFSVMVTAPLMVFAGGYSLSKGTSGTSLRKVWKAATAARACAAAPIANDSYVFTVTDSSKYSITAYDITDNTPEETDRPQAVDGIWYQGGTKSISWKTSDSVTTEYVWVALKKNDGTSFTDAELAHGAEAVFTYTSS